MGCTVEGRSVSVPLHIDDFIFVGPPSTDGCARDLRAFLQSCDELGVVMAPHKPRGLSHGVRHRDTLWLDGNAPVS